jgi:hypothetical protein
VIGVEKFLRARMTSADRQPNTVSGLQDEDGRLLAHRDSLIALRQALVYSGWALGFALFAALLSVATAILVFLN